jgi:hypothetical protein
MCFKCGDKYTLTHTCVANSSVLHVMDVVTANRGNICLMSYWIV